MVWAGILLGGSTDLYGFHGGSLTGERYRDEILDLYVSAYAGAVGKNLVLMGHNARLHRATVFEDYLKGSQFNVNGTAISLCRP